jgi:signal transduction histidine kinase
VRVCSEQLKKALSYVLENAVKFTYYAKSHSRSQNTDHIPSMRVSIMPNQGDLGRGVSIVVEDNGKGFGFGIYNGEKEKIFKKGFRGSNVGQVPGGGMGLFESRKLLSNFKARIEVMDNGPDNLEGLVIIIMMFSDC